MSVSHPTKHDKFPLSYFDHEFPLPVIAKETRLDQSIQPRRLQPIVKRTITEVSDEVRFDGNKADKIESVENKRDDLEKDPDAVKPFHSKKKRTKEEKRARKQAKKSKLEAAKASEAEYIETFEDND